MNDTKLRILVENAGDSFKDPPVAMLLKQQSVACKNKCTGT